MSGCRRWRRYRWGARDEPLYRRPDPGVFALLVVVLAIGTVGRRKVDHRRCCSTSRRPQFVLPQLGDARAVHSAQPAEWPVVRAERLEIFGTRRVPGRTRDAARDQRSGRVPLVGLNWKDEDAFRDRLAEPVGQSVFA